MIKHYAGLNYQTLNNKWIMTSSRIIVSTQPIMPNISSFHNLKRLRSIGNILYAILDTIYALQYRLRSYLILLKGFFIVRIYWVTAKLDYSLKHVPRGTIIK